MSVWRTREENNAAKVRSAENKGRNRQKKVERKASSPPSRFVWISLDASRQQTEKEGGGGMTRGGERRRQTRGMTCLHKKGKEIRNLNYCGMRKALWHQFSWQPENSAACLPACAVRKRKQAADEGRGWRKRRRREWRRAEKIITVQQCSGKKNKHRRKTNMEEWRIEKRCQRLKMNNFRNSIKKNVIYNTQRKKWSKRESVKLRMRRQRGGAARQAGAAGPSRQAPKQDVFWLVFFSLSAHSLSNVLRPRYQPIN